jgi:hypothetical protein
MRSTVLAVGAVVLIASAGIAFAFGVGPAPGGDSGDDIESFPTEEDSTSADSTAQTSTEETATPIGPPFSSSIDRIEECGETCRDVTTTLTNEQATAESNVTVYTRIYAGQGTDGQIIWEGIEEVGEMDSGESYTTTRRVEISLADAQTVRQNDGWITVQTTVQSDTETMTVTEQRQIN